MERNRRQPSDVRLLLRASAPSSASLLGCFGLATLIVASHIVMLSLSYGTVLPSIFDGDFAANYTNHIVQPLETLFNNSAYSRALAIVIWGCIGLAFYTVVTTVSGLFRRWREAENDVVMVAEGRYIHPLRRSFVLSLLWRVGLGVAAVAALVVLQPTFKRLFSVDGRLFANTFTPHDLYEIFLSIFVWAVMLHAATVFLRLYLLRTRLFGEIIE
ncbi:MAG TPA: hypothetical protein VIM53_02405 [Candidatus Saccharimonadales bacterium]